MRDKKTSKAVADVPKDKLLSKLTVLFFKRPKLTGLIWLVLVVFGIASYTTLLKREGFPSINIPLAIVNGTYIVNDPAKVDAEVAKPISDIALKQSGVDTVQTQSAGNFFSVVIQYKEGTDAKARTQDLENAVKASGKVPEAAAINYSVPNFGVTGGNAKKIDETVSFYADNAATSTEALVSQAQQAVDYLNQHKGSLIQEYFVQNPFQTAVNPLTKQTAVVQKTFDRFGKRVDNQNNYHTSVLIGVTAVKGADVIKLDDQVSQTLGDLRSQSFMRGYRVDVSASYAPSIKDEISELQRVLLEGLLAVLVVGSIVIAVRATFITVISMITVITITTGLLYLIGYSLNVITLFALILGLSLIVDDTIIMVEALDVSRRRNREPATAVSEATRKVSRAMVAATTTAALSFAPLAFVSGILGSFIRAIPVTIISALIISLLVALIFIPFFARFFILRKKQMGEHGMTEVAAGIESKIAGAIAWPMRWAHHSTKRMVSVGLVALVIGLGFIIGAGFIARNVTFNIFPPTKDTNGVTLSMSFPSGTTIKQAQAIAAKADQIAADVIGANFVKASYYDSGSADSANAQIDIISYSKRTITSPEIVKQLEDRFKNFKEATVAVGQVDVGPPASAFTVQIKGDNRQAATKLADDVASYLRGVELKRPNGTTAHFKVVAVANPDQYTRSDGQLNIEVVGTFDAADTSTLVTLAQNEVKKEFDANKLRSYGLGENALGFDLGQEGQNQSSFKTLALAFPVLLAVIYVLLAVQFRSLLQPLLIFMAIPFSLFGVMLGLYLTDNPISFFSMLGFFALIGLSLKNTILLTDYANQARRSGMGRIDSAVAALGERFRPLVATSLTAVVSLIPLAVTSPFWQGLAVVLIFGLLSSTFLVITVFPYYYLGGEFLRAHISRRSFLLWLVVTAVLVVGISLLTSLTVGLWFILLALVAAPVWNLLNRRVVRTRGQ